MESPCHHGGFGDASCECGPIGGGSEIKISAQIPKTVMHRDAQAIRIPSVLGKESASVDISGEGETLIVCHFGPDVEEEGSAGFHGPKAPSSVTHTMSSEEEVINETPRHHTEGFHICHPWPHEQGYHGH